MPVPSGYRRRVMQKSELIVPSSVMALLLCLAASLHAVDKSGVATNTISLPEGPGSIEGLGEAFQPTLNTGTSKYQVGLSVPPGTTGFAPEVALVYEGGGGNSPLGIGWNMPIPYIQRQTDEGIPRYDGNDIFINEMSEELVPVPTSELDFVPIGSSENEYFLCENEGAFIRYQRVGDYWHAKQPDGTLMEFGISSDSRITSESQVIFRWNLERLTDTNGNTITFDWSSMEGTLDEQLREPNLNQKYLTRISYGPGAPPWISHHFISFEYIDRDRTLGNGIGGDWFEDCRPGFPVRTGMLLDRILIGTQGVELPGHTLGDFNDDGIDDYLVRSYELDYDTHPFWSLLKRVTPVGASGVNRQEVSKDTEALPPSEFGYYVCAPDQYTTITGNIITSINEPIFSPDNSLADFLDVNGDGLPDILKTEGFNGTPTVYLNRGESSNGMSIRWQSSRPVQGDPQINPYNLSDESGNVAHLSDMDGDGVSDFVVTTLDKKVFYYRNNSDLSFSGRINMAETDGPPSPFQTDEPGSILKVTTADINFDKRIDIIQSDNSANPEYQVWYIWVMVIMSSLP